MIIGQTAKVGTTLWICPAARFSQMAETIPQYQLQYAANQQLHAWWQYTGTAPNAVPTARLRKVTKIKRSSEIISIADCTLPSGVYTCIGELDDTYLSQGTLQNVAKENVSTVDPTNGLPGWSKNVDAGTTYHPRYRHSRNDRTGCLFLDGHVDSFSYSAGEMKMKNISAWY